MLKCVGRKCALEYVRVVRETDHQARCYYRESISLDAGFFREYRQGLGAAPASELVTLFADKLHVIPADRCLVTVTDRRGQP